MTSQFHFSGALDPEFDPASLHPCLETFLKVLDLKGKMVNVLFADDAVLQSLNQRFRGLNRPTDVLSWCYAEEPDALRAEGGLLGEIALSGDRIRSQAKENGWDDRTELLRLLAHGCAHLAGYEHQTPEEEKRMKGMEVKMLEEIGLAAIYPA